MDRLRVIEVVADVLREECPEALELDPDLPGEIADALIRSGALRSFRPGGEGDGGATMPEGPWAGRP